MNRAILNAAAAYVTTKLAEDLLGTAAAEAELRACARLYWRAFARQLLDEDAIDDAEPVLTLEGGHARIGWRIL